LSIQAKHNEVSGYMPNEQDIIRRISEGDEHAFEIYVMHYGPQVEKAIWQVVKSETPVKDILQDILLNIWIAREKLPTLSNPHTWLFRITYFRSYTWLRQQARKNRLHTDSFSYNIEVNTVEEQSAFEETRRFIQEAIEGLPPQTKKVYLLSREEHRSISEIASLLQLSTQTVKNTLSNALRNIRQHLEEQGIIIPGIIISLTLH
jgi:RNA polymerase sigma factor (sigma-70 family)